MKALSVQHSLRFRTALPLVIALALIAGACEKPRTSEDTDDIELTSGPVLGEDGLRALLMRGHRLYWSLPAMATGERTTFGSQAMARIDPAKAASLKALRTLLAPAFTSAATDSVLADLGVREREGKLWIQADAGDDVSNYADADVTDLVQDSTQVTATVEVPLGDSGQIDEQTVRAVRSGNTWKLASNPFGGSEGILSDE